MAEARLPRTHPGGAGGAAEVPIHAHLPGSKPRCNTGRPGGIPRPDVGAKPVDRVVREPHPLVFGPVETGDRDHRSEGLLVRDPVALLHAGQDGRRIEPARPLRLDAADPKLCALLDRRADLGGDLGPLALAHERPHLDAVRASVPVGPLTREPHDLGLKLLRDGVGHVDALDRATDLPRVPQAVLHRAAGGRIEVRVLKDDHGVLASELEDQPLQRPGGRVHDPLPGGPAPDEPDHVHLGLHQGRARRAVPLDKLEDALRELGLEQLREACAGQRSVLARLEHHRVPGDERGRDDGEWHAHGEVPRRDRGDHPQRLMDRCHVLCPAPGGPIAVGDRSQGRHHLLGLCAHAGGVALHLPHGRSQGLAHLPRHRLTEVGGVRREPLPEARERGRPRLSSQLGPGPLGRPRPRHGRVDLHRAGAGDLCEQLARGGVEVGDDRGMLRGRAHGAPILGPRRDRAATSVRQPSVSPLAPQVRCTSSPPRPPPWSPPWPAPGPPAGHRDGATGRTPRWRPARLPAAAAVPRSRRGEAAKERAAAKRTNGDSVP